MSDEREKAGVGETEDGDNDVEAHKSALNKTSVDKAGVGESDDDNDFEAHKYTVGRNAIGATDEDEKASIS
jgi:hypothetical protein